MESVRLIAQTEDATFAGVTFGSFYRGTTTITHATDIVVSWIDDVFNIYAPPACSHHLIYVGIHIECIPPYPSIAFIELCVGSHCLVYQVQHCSNSDPPVRLKDFLSDARFCFIGVNVDLTILQLQTWSNFRVPSAADLGEAALRSLLWADLQRAGLDEMVRKMMGVELLRLDGAQRNALFERVVPLELVAHVCMDAIFSHEIGRILFS